MNSLNTKSNDFYLLYLVLFHLFSFLSAPLGQASRGKCDKKKRLSPAS